MKIFHHQYPQQTSFKAGLSKNFITNFSKLKSKDYDLFFNQNNIGTDFKGNNAIAYCCMKSLELIKELNKKKKTSFGFPNAIIVEDFNNLKNTPNDAWGICNLFPTKLYKNSNFVIPEKTIFFNSNEMIFKDKNLFEYMDAVAEEQTKSKKESSNHFLIKFMHEFVHSIHENHLLKKYSGEEVLNIIKNYITSNESLEYMKKNKKIIDKEICGYASSNPFETISCDLSRKILEPEKYEINEFYLNKKETKESTSTLSSILNNFWNGKKL